MGLNISFSNVLPEDMKYYVFVRKGDPQRKPKCLIIGITTDLDETDREYNAKSWTSEYKYKTKDKLDITSAEMVKQKFIEQCIRYGGERADLNEFPEMDENWYVFKSN